MRSVADYPPLAPRSVEIRPTNACQLDCVGCWYYSPHVAPRSVAWRRSALDREVFAAVLDDLAAEGFHQLTISGGGEPLAHPAIYELLELAAKRFDVLLISNVLLCKDPARLVASGVKWILANFNAGTPRTYAAYHPNQPEESFARLIAILGELSALSVTLSCVLGRVNCDDVPSMLRVAARTTKRIHFKTMRSVAAAVMTDAQRAELDRRLPEYAALADALGVRHNLGVYRVDSDRPPIETVSCYAGYYTTVIHADGSVTVCCQGEQDARASGLGNVNERRFRDIWRSAEYDARRDALEARRFEPWCTGCVYYAQNKGATDAVALLDLRRLARGSA